MLQKIAEATAGADQSNEKGDRKESVQELKKMLEVFCLCLHQFLLS